MTTPTTPGATIESTQTSNPFAQVVVDQSAAAASITNAIANQNTVVLGFCNALIEQTLKAMVELSAIVAGNTGSGNTDTTATNNMMNKVLDALQQQAAQAPQEVEAPPTAATTSSVDPQIIDAIYIQEMNMTIKNSITAQQQLYITAQAATVQTIAVILNTATASMGNRIKQ